MKLFFTACMVAVLLAVTSCGGGTAKPERKKMLTVNSLGVSEQYNASSSTGLVDFPFSTGEMDVQSGSIARTYHSVSLPDASYDSIAIGLIAGRRPLAVSLLAQWAQQEHKGVVIDLRSSTGANGQRADYTLERSGAFSIPVVFLYDRSSAARVAAFVEIMQSVPEIQCRRSSNYSTSSRQDCFH
jgi:hypothetical protein